MQLCFEEHTARLMSVNPRAECHGEDKALGADIKLEIKTTNDVLAEIHPSLKSLLFMPPDESQGELLERDPHHMPKLRFPDMKGPVKWDWDSVGYTLHVHYGVSGKSDIRQLDCKIGKLTFAPIEGGSVSLGLRLQFSPTPETMGRLCELIGQDITLSLEPPSDGIGGTEDDEQ